MATQLDSLFFNPIPLGKLIRPKILSLLKYGLVKLYNLFKTKVLKVSVNKIYIIQRKPNIDIIQFKQPARVKAKSK